MRFAIISDIHGNLPALHAVLEDIHQADVDQIICLGDIANGGPFPAQCIQQVQAVTNLVIQGNHELYLLDKVPDADFNDPSWGVVHWTRAQLSSEQMTYQDQLPISYELFPDTLFYHASPLDQFRGFLGNTSDGEIAERMNKRDHVTLFVGHTHRFLYRQWSNSWIVNCGSVGMPLDGTPQAKYLIATHRHNHWQVEFRVVPYDYDCLHRAFEQSGIQQANPIFAGLFRYQMATGKQILVPYLDALRRFADLQGISQYQAYHQFPVPALIQPFLISQ